MAKKIIYVGYDYKPEIKDYIVDTALHLKTYMHGTSPSYCTHDKTIHTKNSVIRFVDRKEHEYWLCTTFNGNRDTTLYYIYPPTHILLHMTKEHIYSTKLPSADVLAKYIISIENEGIADNCINNVKEELNAKFGFRGGSIYFDGDPIGYLNHDINMTYELHSSTLKIEKVIFNEPATIVFWNDGTKTVVKAQNGDAFDKEKGLAMAISKKTLGNNRREYYNVFKKYLKNKD